MADGELGANELVQELIDAEFAVLTDAFGGSATVIAKRLGGDTYRAEAPTYMQALRQVHNQAMR